MEESDTGNLIGSEPVRLVFSPAHEQSYAGTILMNKIYKEEAEAEPTQQSYSLTTAAVTITGDKHSIQRTSHKVRFSSI